MQAHFKMNIPNLNRTLHIRLFTAAVLALAATARSADTPTLKETFRNHFQIGTALNRSIVTGNSFRRSAELVSNDIAQVKMHFNQAVAENDMKWEMIILAQVPDGSISVLLMPSLICS